MKLYVSCFISFILGGIVFAYFTFNYSIKHFSNFNAHGRYVSYILQGTDSIKIIENIQNENFDEAFFLLESNIDSAKTLLELSDCSFCKDTNSKTRKVLYDYKYIQFPNYPSNEQNP